MRCLAVADVPAVLRAGTVMTDRGIHAVADMVAHHSSLSVLWVDHNINISSSGWSALAAAVRRNPNLALRKLRGVDLARHDDTLPRAVAEANDRWSNEHALSCYCAQARVRRRVAAVAVLRLAWQRSNGRPMAASPSISTCNRAATLAHMLQLRRLCRVRDGLEVVEPFGRAVLAYL